MTEQIKQAFDSIHAETELKEQTRQYLSVHLKHRQAQRRFRIQVALSAACLFFLLIGFGGYRLYFSQSFLISIDINPSIELHVNRFDKVISAHSYNEDGERLLHTVKVQFMDYKKALHKLLDSQSITSYLEQEELLSISVSGKNEQKCEEMLTGIESSLPPHHNVCCSMGNLEEAEAAHAAGLSVGKYRTFLELQEVYPDMTIEDVKGMTMREIEELLTPVQKEDTDTKKHKNRHRHRHQHQS